VISTRQLRYFVEIADSGSFSAAAERLFVAQSALSRQIKALETQAHGAPAKADGSGRGLLSASAQLAERTAQGR
jgi:hypothetical protein